jgi:hypothetical protein
LTWNDCYDYLVTFEVSAIRENGATSGAGVLATFAYAAFGDDIFFPDALASGKISPPSLEIRNLNDKVSDVLKIRKGSIKNAPLPPGSPTSPRRVKSVATRLSSQSRLGPDRMLGL